MSINIGGRRISKTEEELMETQIMALTLKIVDYAKTLHIHPDTWLVILVGAAVNVVTATARALKEDPREMVRNFGEAIILASNMIEDKEPRQ